MIPSESILIGYVAKTHGLYGNFSIKLEGTKEFCSACLTVKKLYTEKAQLLNVKKTQLNSNIFLRVNTLEITNREEAKSLLRTNIYIQSGEVKKIDNIIKSQNKLIGFQVINQNKKIGIIESIDYKRIQPIMKIRGAQYEILAPYVSNFILNIDKREKKVIVDFPDGLVDICKN